MSSQKESRKRTRAQLESLKITIQNKVVEQDKMRVVQIEPVSNKTLLSEFLHEFIIDCSTIIGVHRVADYNARITDSVVFIYITSYREYKQLIDQRTMILEGRVVNITDPELISGSARYLVPFAVGAEVDIHSSPMPMALFGFRQLFATSTFYVIAVLRVLEQEHLTTGFRLAYCERARMTRNFGFATFISRMVALQLNEKQFYVLTDRIEAKLPNSTPVLIHVSKEYLIRQNRCDLTDEVREANWLHANLADPTLPIHPIEQNVQPETSGIVNASHSRAHSPIRAPQASSSNPSSRPMELSSNIRRNPVQRNPNEVDNVIRHNTPPASPDISIGDDYDIDEEGDLQIAKKQRK
jgi:hypothetical protein